MVNIMIAKDVHQRGAEGVASCVGAEQSLPPGEGMRRGADSPGIGNPSGAFRRVVEDADPYC